MSYQELLSGAEAFYDQCCEAFEQGKDVTARRYATASVLFSWIAIESFVNNMLEDFASLPPDMFTIHERGFLEEHSVQFSSSGSDAGRFVLTNRPEHRRLEEKILFLIAKSSDFKLDKGSSAWQRFEQAKTIRDRLTHPKKKISTSPSAQDAKIALDVARETIQLVSSKVWRKTVTF